MARRASGIDCIADARAFRDNDKTAEDLRLATDYAEQHWARP